MSGERCPGLGFLVLASAKSGTTWMQRLLSAHPELHCGETRLFGDYFDPTNLSGPHLTLEWTARRIVGHQRVVPAEDHEAASHRLLSELIDAVCARARSETGKPVYGEKLTPFRGTGVGCVESLARYDRATPTILLSRDGRDIIASGVAHQLNIRKRVGSAAESERAAAMLQAREMPGDLFELFVDLAADAAAAHNRARAVLTRTIEVSYEAMAADAAREARRVFAFLGVDPSCAESCARASSFEAMSGGRRAGEEDRGSAVRKGTPGDWKNWFTPEHERRYQEAMTRRRGNKERAA